MASPCEGCTSAQCETTQPTGLSPWPRPCCSSPGEAPWSALSPVLQWNPLPPRRPRRSLLAAAPAKLPSCLSLDGPVTPTQLAQDFIENSRQDPQFTNFEAEAMTSTSLAQMPAARFEFSLGYKGKPWRGLYLSAVRVVTAYRLQAMGPASPFEARREALERIISSFALE